MQERLIDQFKKQDRGLEALMSICKTDARLLHVVCVGAGDAFIDRYWPTLRRELARKRVVLTVADNMPLDELLAKKRNAIEHSHEGDERKKRVLRNYEAFRERVERGPGAKYVDLNDDTATSWYDQMFAQIVFILVPDQMHIEKAEPWLGRADLILVEKPYDREYRHANQLQDEIRKMMGTTGPITWVVPFDHYLAKIFRYDVYRNNDRLVDEIGGIRRVEFSLLETQPVETWRATSLRAGMLYDLFSHVLAMLTVELEVPPVPGKAIRKMKVARYHECPDDFEGETYAGVHLGMQNPQGYTVEVEGEVGKGVGEHDKKDMKFIGDGGWIRFDLGAKEPGVYLKRGEDPEDPVYEVGKGHPEFLDRLLAGQYLLDPIGGLTGDAAVRILSMLDAMEVRIKKEGVIPKTYKCGASLEDVRKSAVSR